VRHDEARYPHPPAPGPPLIPPAVNLELWTRPQPAGIRVSDAIAWAREILARYPGYKDTSNNAHGLP